MTHPEVGDRVFFSQTTRRKIERLACTAPAQVGWQVTHWSTRSLAVAAAEQEIVAKIGDRTISRLLRAAHLAPHLWRSWKTTIWDAEAVARALKILWVYERPAWLWQQGVVVMAIDEKPNIQVLERAQPTQLMRPGQIERQAFDYIRHGTINMLAGLTLHTGHMGLRCLPANDGEHFRPAVRHLLHPYAWAEHIWLIIDNGPSHTSADTLAFFDALAPRVRLRVLFTPVNASWLNQAESLIEAFADHYLHRGSWTSKLAMIDHLLAARIEYNHYFAHPFVWHWTRADFRFWLNNTPGLIRCRTNGAAH
jgi:hypothetical protein